MVEGAASLITGFYGLRGFGAWSDKRGDNIIDGGAPFYSVYEAKDGKYVTLGAIEAKFYALMLVALGLAGDPVMDDQMNKEKWPAQREKIAAVMATKTRDEWTALLEGTDICYAPVLDMAEVKDHPHNAARGSFVEIDGYLQPGPAPKFSRTKAEIQGPPAAPGAHTREVLVGWGFDTEEIDALEAAGAVGWRGDGKKAAE